MPRIDTLFFLFGVTLLTAFSAVAQDLSNGKVIDHQGDDGDLIVSRDGIVYWLSDGDDLFERDILRSSYADTSTITYNGCTFTLPAKQDVLLDDQFCALVVENNRSMASVASANTSKSGSVIGSTSANSPLIVGGVVLSAGGLAAATNGGDSGTQSATSVASGAVAGTVDP